ncbi:MAG TPA: efflux RND transporter permease subunit, partial [Bdellovibrionales bacterium]|nr:efflux RND transporter permease subunit [Bdellovibrionales bacterium]
MFDAIIRFSLRNRLLVVATTCFVMVYGGLALQRLPIDVLPNLNRPTVNILTDARGMAPEEVELMISRPLETAINGTPGVTRIFSTSAIGISVVRVEFDWNTDLRDARLAVSERMQLVKLPEGVEPVISPTSSIMGEIQMIGVEGTAPATELRTFADWTLRPRLLSIPGVS